MVHSEHERVREALHERMRRAQMDLVIPPPAFLAMHGEFVAFDETAKTLSTRFPVLSEQLNPFGTMQGGMIAAAVDNTVGPLSLLVGPASVTRRLEMKYRRAIAASDQFIIVEARLVNVQKRRLLLEATVTNPSGVQVAVARSTHWAIEGSHAP